MWKALLLGIALFLAWQAPAAAQGCAQRPFPTSVVFVPANPAPGQPVTAFLSPASSETYGVPPVRTGNQIDVTGTLFLFPGVPPPPGPVQVALGPLPAGTYLVRFRLFDELPSACLPLDATLVVGGGVPVVTSVPATGLAALLALAGALLVFARRRSLARSRATR